MRRLKPKHLNPRQQCQSRLSNPLKLNLSSQQRASLKPNLQTPANNPQLKVRQTMTQPAAMLQKAKAALVAAVVVTQLAPLMIRASLSKPSRKLPPSSLLT